MKDNVLFNIHEVALLEKTLMCLIRKVNVLQMNEVTKNSFEKMYKTILITFKKMYILVL